jgi:hypothetical protein
MDGVLSGHGYIFIHDLVNPLFVSIHRLMKRITDHREYGFHLDGVLLASSGLTD